MINTESVRNITCGKNFFLYNNMKDDIGSYCLEEETFLKFKVGHNNEKIQDSLLMRLKDDEDQFLAHNTERQSLRIFNSDGRFNLIENLQEVRFYEGPNMGSSLRLEHPIYAKLLSLSS